ncbi:hypothetical protein, partial [Agathobacter sp.]
KDSSDKESYLGFIIKNKKIIMIETSLVLKQIFGILCLLISYSKFTLPVALPDLKGDNSYYNNTEIDESVWVD